MVVSPLKLLQCWSAISWDRQVVCDRIGYRYSPEAYAPCDLTAVRWDHNFMYDVCTERSERPEFGNSIDIQKSLLDSLSL